MPVGFEEQFVERVVEDETTPCLTLGAHWVLVPAKMFDPLFKDTLALRLADDPAGIGLWLTWLERRKS
jgi:hypothetical protein